METQMIVGIILAVVVVGFIVYKAFIEDDNGGNNGGGSPGPGNPNPPNYDPQNKKKRK